MGSLNRATLIGRAANIKPFTTKAGKTITSFSLATNEKFTRNGEQVEETEWHNIVTFGKTAELAERYVEKGDLIYVSGKIKTEEYQDKNSGETRRITKIHCVGFDSLIFLRSKNRDEQRTQPEQRPPSSPLQRDPSMMADDVPF